MEKIIMLLCILVSFISCDSNKLRLVGQVQVKGINNVYFNIYQQDEFDSATELQYSIVDSTGKVILYNTFLTGTHDYFDDVTQFYAGSYDSIVYLNIYEPYDIDAMYDLKTGKGSYKGFNGGEQAYRINDSLFSELKSYNSKLINHLR